MKPEQRVHCSTCRRAHVAESPTTPVMNDVVNVLDGRVPPTEIVDFVRLVGCKVFVRRDEQDTVEPVTETPCQRAASLPLPRLKLILDAIRVGGPCLLLCRIISSRCVNTLDVGVAARCLGARILPFIRINPLLGRVENLQVPW